jgi:butyryl-CoA dehydrogenase
MAQGDNPLISDRDVEFLLYEVLDATALTKLPAFADHSRETFDMFLGTVRRFAREALFPKYRAMDESPPRFESGRVFTHDAMKPLWAGLVDLGVLTATRPPEVGGQHLPITINVFAQAYLMAGNLGASAYVGLTQSAAHLIEAFGDEHLKREMMTRMYEGTWTGTMALTEPQAGSSLSDITTKAVPRGDGTYSITGAKIFISGADHDLTENVVNMTLARIEGAPAGTKGVSLFAVPARRFSGETLVPNDVHVTGVIHKIGWRGLPSLAISFGDEGDCRGWLVGQANRGLGHMFQMMNEARIAVGVSAVATASVAYHESVAYARNRPQGRPLGARDLSSKQVPIIEHADVRRMLLRQKAIVEGGLCLAAFTAKQADLAEHAATAEEKKRARLLLDALTPITKSFPSEWGFESNALAVQIHGGYGYSSEQLPEAWLRDQKLNTIHEGTTGIQGMDLLGRRIVAEGGAPLMILTELIDETAHRAQACGIELALCEAVRGAARDWAETTAHLGALGASGEVDRMMRHSTDYLALASITVVGWLWLWQAERAKAGLARGADIEFYEGKLCAAQYWISNEIPRARSLAILCRSGDDSYARMRDSWFTG